MSLTPSRRADCSACNSISIRSLIIDGNRPLLLRVPKGEALVEMGNADDQEIRDCRLIEPRGWSALHFREGDWKSCSRGVIRNNVIVSPIGLFPSSISFPLGTGRGGMGRGVRRIRGPGAAVWEPTGGWDQSCLQR